MASSLGYSQLMIVLTDIRTELLTSLTYLYPLAGILQQAFLETTLLARPLRQMILFPANNLLLPENLQTLQSYIPMSALHPTV